MAGPRRPRPGRPDRPRRFLPGRPDRPPHRFAL